ncbi:helix-turn-helix domain-containing protein [soil metagenome]
MTVDSWDAAARLCDDILSNIDDLALGITEKIREELSDYVLVPFDEHRASVTAQLRRRVEAFRDRRAWYPPDMELIVQLARQRARQGITVDELIFAYHVSDRGLWQRFVSDPGAAISALPELTSLMLESLQAMTTALAAAHNSESRARDGVRSTAAQRLLGRLAARRFDPETLGLVLYFGFELDKAFVSFAWRPNGELDETSKLMRIIEGVEGAVVAHAQFQSDYLMLVQFADTDSSATLSARLSEIGLVGVGSPGLGIESTAVGIEQARVALTSATTERPQSNFAEGWFLSIATSNAELIASEVADVVAVALANPSLATTIQQFAASNMSIARCARDYHLHPNTVTYRIDRWQKATGWDPRSFSQLTKSVIACALAENPARSGPRPVVAGEGR